MAGKTINTPWWKEDENQAHKRITDTKSWLTKHQSATSALNMRHLRLYGNVDTHIFGSVAPAVMPPGIQNSLKFNLIQSVVDTIHNKMGKIEPKVTFLTEKGNAQLRRKAKKLDRFVAGQFYEVDYYRKLNFQKLFALIFGTGPLKIYEDPERGRINCENVLPEFLQVDEIESAQGQPRQLYQTCFLPKEILLEQFSEFESAIIKSEMKRGKYAKGIMNTVADMVEVTEAWHLPSRDPMDLNGEAVEHDGRHAIAIDGATLLYEEWNRTKFPFTFLRWTERPIGFWGQGAPERLTSLQIELNKVLRTLQLCIHLCAVPRLAISDTSKIVQNHINNMVGALIKYRGQPPLWLNSNTVPPEITKHIEWLITRGFEQEGVTMLSATGRKPSGLDSRPSLREYHDIESERFFNFNKSIGNVTLDAAEQMVEIVKDIAARNDGKDYEVMTKGKDFMETIKWSEVNMPDDKYVMKIFETSQLPDKPEGRMQMVTEMVEAGFIEPEFAPELLEFPDIEAYLARKNAPIRLIEKIIDKIVIDDEFIAPESFMPLQFGINMFKNAYLEAKLENVEPSRLEKMRRWIKTADGLLNKQPQQPAAMQPQSALEQNMMPINPLTQQQNPAVMPPMPPGGQAPVI